jgi:hypothetical protein
VPTRYFTSHAVGVGSALEGFADVHFKVFGYSLLRFHIHIAAE